jgi:hypothetical protein
MVKALEYWAPVDTAWRSDVTHGPRSKVGSRGDGAWRRHRSSISGVVVICAGSGWISRGVSTCSRRSEA